MLIIGLQIAGFQYLIIYISEEYGFSASQAGLLASVQFIPMFLVPLLFGQMLDKYPKRIIAGLCALCYAAGSLLIILFHSVVPLIAGIFVIAIGASISPAMVTVFLAEIAPEKTREYANIVEVFYSLGNVISPLALSVLIAKGMNWRGLYYFVLVAGIGIGAVLFFSKVDSGDLIAEAREEEKFRFDLLLILLIAYAFLYNMIEMGFMNYCSTYFTELFGDDLAAGLSISLVGGSMVISKLISSRLKTDKGTVIIISMILSGMSSAMMFILPGRRLSLVWCLLFGLLTGPSWPTLMSYGIELYPSHSGRVTTLIMLGGGIGGMTVGPLMGLLADASGIASSYIIVSASAFAGALVILLVKKLRVSKRNP